MELYFNGKVILAIGIVIVLLAGCGTYGRKSSITNPNVMAEEGRQRSTSANVGQRNDPLEKKENDSRDSTAPTH